MIFSTGEISEIVSGKLTGPDNIPVSRYFIDSRKATLISGESLFIALEGQRTDGHNFIVSLYNSGIRAFIVSKTYMPGQVADLCPDAAFIATDNTLAALQKLAANKRKRFKGTVIAITGSNGKTIVKEWFSDILGKVSAVLRSPRSYNSQTGVPLSVINLDNSYEYGVFEAGMSMPGEIEKLERIICPDIAVFTNIGEAHQENFKDIESKIKEKLVLFENSKTIIYSPGYGEIDRLIKSDKVLSSKRLFTWTFDNINADVCFRIVSDTGGKVILNVLYRNADFRLALPYSDSASVENAAIVITMLLSIGVSEKIIVGNLEQIKPVEMRMEQKEGINGCTLIEDYYNSDPAALGIALDYLKEMTGRKKRVIISDFVQHRRGQSNIYSEVASMIKKSGVNNTICIGEDIFKAKSSFEKGTLFFRTTEDMLQWYSPLMFRNELILLKGARKFEFEKISSLLVLKAHITTLEINLKNLHDNLNTFRSMLSPGTMTMAMVKAFAYGGGPGQISEWLVRCGIDFLAVAYIDEGKQLREAGISTRIVVMNPDPSSLKVVIDEDLEPEIFSLELLEKFIGELRCQGVKDYPVHIKIDSGMHRLGFMERDIPALLEILKSESRVRVASVFSHLAASEDPSLDAETRKQARRYLDICSRIEDQLGYGFIKHILNSAGIIRFPEYHFDMVRLGIGLYGAVPADMKNSKNVLSFRSSVSQVKTVKAGEGVGYGLTDSSDKDREIAIIPIGYADGLNRMMGNGNGRVYIKSSYVPIVGRICMDMFMADVSDLGVVAGDSVEIFGDRISVYELAERCNTIPYEIITSIPPRVKRIYLYE